MYHDDDASKVEDIYTSVITPSCHSYDKLFRDLYALMRQVIDSFSHHPWWSSSFLTTSTPSSSIPNTFQNVTNILAQLSPIHMNMQLANLHNPPLKPTFSFPLAHFLPSCRSRRLNFDEFLLQMSQTHNIVGQLAWPHFLIHVYS